jgi:hypothetical protein
MLTVNVARKHNRCRVCEKPILVGGLLAGEWKTTMREIFQPEHVILNYGSEFAHQSCLRPKVD